MPSSLAASWQSPRRHMPAGLGLEARPAASGVWAAPWRRASRSNSVLRLGTRFSLFLMDDIHRGRDCRRGGVTGLVGSNPARICCLTSFERFSRTGPSQPASPASFKDCYSWHLQAVLDQSLPSNPLSALKEYLLNAEPSKPDELRSL